MRGRLRVQAAQLRNNPIAIEGLRQQLGSISGVRRLTSNPAIGSITTEYAPGTELATVLAAFRDRCIEMNDLTKRARPGAVTAQSASLWRSLLAAGVAAHVLFDLLVWGMAAVALVSR